jgi:translation initiation factor 2 alpha subunit (eIF-2alpha)
MHAYEVTFHASPGAMTKRVEAEDMILAVALATVDTVRSLEEMTRQLGPVFGVEFGEATEGFELALKDGEITLDINEVA